MTSATPTKPKKKFFTVEEANKTLPLVEHIVADIVRQWEVVSGLEQRLSRLAPRGVKERSGDLYDEEVAQSVAELEAERAKLHGYIEELKELGVELKGFDGLCDFPSLRDGREVYLCWRLGESAVGYWHELNTGFAGRQPLHAGSYPRAESRVVDEPESNPRSPVDLSTLA